MKASTKQIEAELTAIETQLEGLQRAILTESVGLHANRLRDRMNAHDEACKELFKRRKKLQKQLEDLE